MKTGNKRTEGSKWLSPYQGGRGPVESYETFLIINEFRCYEAKIEESEKKPAVTGSWSWHLPVTTVVLQFRITTS